MLRRLPLRALALAHRLPTTPISASSTAYFHGQCSLFSSSSSSQIPDSNVIQRLGHEEDVLNPPVFCLSTLTSLLRTLSLSSISKALSSMAVSWRTNFSSRMVGVWAMRLWEQMGRPDKVNLVELGPGRGTLMADLLRELHRFVACTLLPTILIAHEFFDALPVYQFQRTSRGWCEKMVDVAEGSKLKFVPSPEPTPATIFLMKRYKYSSNEEIANVHQIEICPKALELTQAITRRISSDGGGALTIDYGLNGVVSDSLQAIRKHTFVDILDNPGDVAVYGPMTQSQFLGSLGINSRVQALLENSTDEQAESLRTGYWRLVGEDKAPFWEGPDEDAPIGMGTRYMAMAIVNKKHSIPVPFL
ncbi:Protein arginine methyltransferase NDUFAF7, mitochondrial, partial [Cucurbita argyrosperma subsp. sororia]